MKAHLSNLAHRLTSSPLKTARRRLSVRFCISALFGLTGLLILIGLGTLTAASGDNGRAKATNLVPKFDGLTTQVAETVPADAAQSVTVNNSAQVTVRAAGRGKPFFNFGDGHGMAAEYHADQQVANALQSGSGAPRALASADFDGNGTPDVVIGYASDGTGMITLQRGNPDAFAPADDSVFARLQQGYNPDSLLPATNVSRLPVPADFLVVGDFNHDSKKDVLIAAKGGGLYLLAGDGKGGFGSPREITLPGTVTALIAGEFGAADGFTDVAVGVTGSGGNQLLIFDTAGDGFSKPLAQLKLAAPATAVEFGGLDDDPFLDVAAAAGSEILVVHGWGRKESVVPEGRVERINMGGSVRGLAVGEFTWDREGRSEIAALTDDGAVNIVQHRQLDMRPFADWEKADRKRGKIKTRSVGLHVDMQSVPSWQPGAAEDWTRSRRIDAGTVNSTSAKPLMKTHLSRREMDDLTLTGDAQAGLEILRPMAPSEEVSNEALLTARTVTATADGGPPVAKVTLDTASQPVAVLQLPQKLNGVSDMVVLNSGQSTPSIVPNAPNTTITVDRFDDPNGASLAAASVCSAAANDCSLRGAFQFANNAANPGTTINLPAGTYILSTNGTSAGGCDGNAVGDLGANQSTTITGAGAATTIIRQTGTGPANDGDRIMCMNEPFTVGLVYTFSGVTFVGGREGSAAGTGTVLGGAGIIGGELNNSLTLTSVVFANNQETVAGSANLGGGGLQITGGSLIITNSTFGGSSAPGAYTDRSSTTTGNLQTGSGAGITYTPSSPMHTGGSGTLTVSGSTFSRNNSFGIGGGGADLLIFAFAAPGGIGSGSASIGTSAFSNNQAANGGGIIVESLPTTVATTSVTNNAATNRGGAIFVGGASLLLDGSGSGVTMTGNTAPGGGTSISTAAIVNVSGTNVTLGGSIIVATGGNWTNNAGSTLSPTDIDITGGQFNMNNSTMNVAGNLTVGPAAIQGSTFNGGSGTVNIAGNLTTNAGGSGPVTTFNGGTGTFNFNGSGAQSISGTLSPSFGNLTVTKTGGSTLTLSTSATVAGNLTLTSGIFDLQGNTVNRTAAGGTLTVSNGGALKIGGTNTVPSNYSTHSIGGTGTIEYAGTNQSVAVLNSSQNYGNLTVSGSGTKTLGGNITVASALTLTSSTVVTNANVLSMGASATRSRTSGYIIGNEKKTYSAAGSFTYDVGTANGYSPADANVTAGTGDLTVVTTQGANPNVVSSRSLQRYWTLTEGGALTANLTFHYLDPTDLMGTEANYQPLQITGATRTYFANNCPAQCVDTAANTFTLSGLTDFTAFTAGEPRADIQITGVTDTPDPVVAGNNITYTIGFINNGPDNATSVTVTDAVPANTTFVSATVPSGWTRSDSVTVGGTGSIIFNKGTVASGETASFQLVVNVNSNALGGASITNTATAATVAVDPTLANNSGNATTLVYQPPVITSSNSTTFTVGTNGNFSVTTTGFPTPSISRGGVALPSGVSFIDNGNGTGTLSGTPAAGTGGTYAITFTASNAAGTTTPQSFTLTVNQAPAITSANSTTFTVGSAGTFTVTRTGFPTPTLSESGALPSGVTFAPATGVLSGTPAAGTGGTYPITFTASNGVGSNAVQSFTLTVNQPPAITSTNSTTFTVGTAGSFNVTATGNPSPTFSETGTLPGGVTLSAAGLLGGIPQADTDGNYPISIKASNGVGSDATQAFTLTVNPTVCTPPPANMISWFPGDGNASDLIGGHDGTLVGGATANAVGEVNQAFQFQGTTQEVDVPNSTVYDFGANDFTIDTWVKLNAVSGTDIFVAHDGGVASNKWIFWLHTGNLAIRYEGPAVGGAVDIGVPFTPNTGQWYHLAVTRSGSTYKFYVNGAQLSGNQTNVTNVPPANALLTLGKAGSVNAINGFLDEVEIFSRALAGTELASIYYSGRFGKCNPPFQLSSAVSRKTHGGAGPFDVNLPLSGPAGIECREGGGNHTLVFTFSNAVVSGNVSIISGIGSVSGSPTFAGKTMTVNLTGVTNQQQITIKLSSVTDAIAQVLPDTSVNMIALAGDTTGDKSVNSADVSQTKSKSGQAVDATNFRNDVTVDGTINSADVSLVKSKSGTALP